MGSSEKEWPDWSYHYAQAVGRTTLGQAVDSKTGLISGARWGGAQNVIINHTVFCSSYLQSPRARREIQSHHVVVTKKMLFFKAVEFSFKLNLLETPGMKNNLN